MANYERFPMQNDNASASQSSLSPPTVQRIRIDSISPSLPPLPASAIGTGLDLGSIISAPLAENVDETEKVQKRASMVIRLNEENEKLQAQLREMNERLEAAERRRQELASREQREITNKGDA